MSDQAVEKAKAHANEEAQQLTALAGTQREEMVGKRLKGMPKVARAAVAALAPQAGRVPSSYEDACKQDLQHPDQTSSRFRS